MISIKKFIILLMIICALSGCANKASKVESASSNSESSPTTPIYYTSAYDEKELEELGITLNSTKIAPKTGKTEVRRIAEDLLRQTAIQPKGIYIEYGLITAPNVGLGALSIDAMEANPILKNKKSISEIPVWIITLKGLLPDDYKPDTRPGKQPLDISSTVIDAMTGKVLFGFGKGK
ncbi:hypothetical protein [Paenibacillus glycanilyticus]|uniref:hypothetical protein n=1 Tax=Paenibacillus glycanilyticus TaxID=126569 RepID=UPI000FD835BB|nr:hypothetical protein [Paenibacillus glycanilyticus]